MRGRTLALLALGSLIGPVGIAAQDTVWNRYTLEGLGGVFIRAEADPVCESVGVTAASAQTDAALQLLQTEVGLLTEEDMLAHPGLPELRITLECRAGERGLGDAMAYSIGLRIQQAAQMIRDTQVTLAEAVTWYSTAIGVMDPDDAEDRVKDVLSEQLDAFSTAFAEANTEEEPESR